jgi:hypothetical protein
MSAYPRGVLYGGTRYQQVAHEVDAMSAGEFIAKTIWGGQRGVKVQWHDH